MKKLIIVAIILCTGLISNAQKPEKVLSSSVFKAMDATAQADIDDELNDALADFKKVLVKEPDNVMAHFGLSVVYSYDKYTGRDYFEAWKYFKTANEKQSMFTTDETMVLNEYFFKQNKRRRNRPLNKNMEWERGLVEDKLIKYVREENKVEHADRFLNEFPESKYASNVEHIRTYIVYRTAENTNSVQAYEDFLSKYPNAAQKEIAILKRDILAFKKAVELNSLTALKSFTASYPEAVQVEEAKKMMSLLAYDVAAKSRSLEVLENFMTEYPNSTKMPDAKILKKQLLFEWAKSVNTIEAYNKFVALYPEGSHYIDIFNLKANALGQQLLMDFPMEDYKFIKAFDNQGISDFGGSVVKKNNGEIVVVANSKLSKDDRYDTWLLGLDAEGKMKWNSFLGNKFDDFANKVIVNSANEIYVAGITNAIKDSIPGQSWLFKLAPDGSNIYNAKLEGTEVLGLGVYDDGSAIISSYTNRLSDSVQVPMVIKVNKKGKKLWSRTYSKAGKGYDLKVVNNIAYLTTGNWICAIDENGYLKWDQYLLDGQLITAVGYNSAGHAIFVGKKGDEGYGLSLDASGKKLWEQVYTAPGSGDYDDVLVFSEGSYLLSGTFNNGLLMAKIGSDGVEIKRNNFSLPDGLSLNGLTIIEGTTVVVSATKLGKQSDIIVFKMSF